MSAVAERTRISLEVACASHECANFAYPLERQLALGQYDHCSVLRLPDEVTDWRKEHKTARKRADRCQRRGYRFVDVVRREREEEIWLINTSIGMRQGRPMSPGYQEKPVYGDDSSLCSRHGVHAYGVEEPNGTLVAYLFAYRAGDLVLVSQILGHADHLKDEIMWLLWQGMLARELSEPGFVVYNRHDSGTDGLRFYKEHVGLVETEVEWSI